MVADMAVATEAMVAVMAAATGISAAEATGILAGTTVVGGSQYPVHFRAAVLTAIARLPDVAVRTSARSGTPRLLREASATR